MMTGEVTTLTGDTPQLDERTQQSNIRTALAFIRTIDAEKRTHLAELRTGIGILTIPMSLLTILIATSNYYSVIEVLPFITGLVVGIVILICIGGYLVYSSINRIRKDERLRNSCDDISCLVAEFNNHD
ncbi:MAG: hypothetical protein ACFFEV_10090 [Candidatus Thorarchaeota archaeon]